MPKITPSPLIQSMSGKLCAHSDTYFATNKQTGNVIAVKICNPSEAEPTEKQIEHRVSFASRAQLVKQWFATNKPSDSNPSGTDEYVAVRKRFKDQHKIGSFAGFVNKYMQTDGTVGSAVSKYTTTPTEGQTTGGTTSSGGSTSGGSGAPNLE